MAQNLAFVAPLGRTQTEEDAMLVSEFISIINAIAALIYTLAKLIRSLRRPP